LGKRGTDVQFGGITDAQVILDGAAANSTNVSQCRPVHERCRQLVEVAVKLTQRTVEIRPHDRASAKELLEPREDAGQPRKLDPLILGQLPRPRP
jgi:hypothetical protein